MNKQDIVKIIRKYIFENRNNLGVWTDFNSKEMMGAAKDAAMKDIRDSGEEFQDLGKSKFEKDLSVSDMIKDLENAKQGKTGKNLSRIENQINQLKRFGSGSLNEFEEDEFEGPAKEIAKKDIEATGAKFVDLGQSKFEKNLNKEKLFKDLKNVNEENLDENYFVSKYADGLEKLMDKTKPYTNKEFLDLFTQKHALQHSSVMNALKDELRNRGINIENELEEEVGRSLASGHGQNSKPKNFPNSLKGGRKNEGAGLGLGMKHSMNVKPTHGK